MEIPCVSFQLRRLTRRISSIYDHHLAQAGLRGTQYSMLSVIAMHRLIGTAALAAQLGMDRSTLSRNLKPLVRAGWVIETRPEPGVLPDSRSYAVELSAEGRQKRREGQECWQRARAQVAELCGQENCDELMATLGRTYAKLDAGLSAQDRSLRDTLID